MQIEIAFQQSPHVPDRIVRVSLPFIRPIVRSKAGKPVEFGVKLDISVVNSWRRLEYFSFDAYNETGNLQEIAERFSSGRVNIPSGFSQTRSIATGTIWPTARSIIFGFSFRHLADRRRIQSPTKASAHR